MLRVGDELITLIDPDAPASEAYRTLRTNILIPWVALGCLAPNII